jgi:hypothetical protein
MAAVELNRCEAAIQADKFLLPAHGTVDEIQQVQPALVIAG